MGDKNLRHPQKLTGQRLDIIELPTNRRPALRPLRPQIIQAVDRCQAASHTVVAGACKSAAATAVARRSRGTGA